MFVTGAKSIEVLVYVLYVHRTRFKIWSKSYVDKKTHDHLFYCNILKETKKKKKKTFPLLFFELKSGSLITNLGLLLESYKCRVDVNKDTPHLSERSGTKAQSWQGLQ